MNRWKMHKLGFVNFWLYGLQEFPISDGHILLRGANASGKSITTQSFIPFLMDGNKSPERLDAFGSRDRRMEFYLLGNGEREESTGYLYLEFKKENVEEYLTIGIGLRAQKGKPQMDFWGFCLNDGRRIGESGIRLYETIGRDLVPLSKKKLRNLLDDLGNWAETQRDYKALVNRKVFGFEQLVQYDQLIQLLIKVRAPKLSRDGFRPSAVKEILNDSLQVLTDEDLSAMVATMERMDRLETTMQDQKKAMQDARIIQREYQRYNLYMLGSKAKAYLDAQQSSLSLRNHLADAEERVEKNQAELTQNQQLREQALLRLQEIAAQREALAGTDLAEKQKQLETEAEHTAQLKAQQTEAAEDLDQLHQTLHRAEQKSQLFHQEERNQRTELRSLQKELQEEERIVLLGEAFNRLTEQLQRETLESGEVETVRQCLAQRRKQLRQAMDGLQKVRREREQHDAACEQVDRASTELRAASQTLTSAKAQEQEERDLLLEAFARYVEDNQVLLLDAEQKVELRQRIARYQSNADWGGIRNPVEDVVSDCRRGLLEQQVRTENECKEIQKKLDELKQAYQRVETERDPVPPRREHTEATRRFLAMQAIPCAPFYQLVDFRENLPQRRRDQLEAQLRDAGILDALVVSENCRPQLTEVLESNPDQFLLPGLEVDDPLDELIPVCSEELRESVAQCLRGISQSDLSAHTALLPDGTFRNGMLRGCSDAQEQAGYIGTAAREANRQRQLAALQKDIDYWQAALQPKQTVLQQVERALTLLQQEWDALPSPENLDQAMGMVREAEAAVRQAERQETRCLELVKQAKQRLEQAEQKLRDTAQVLPYQRDMDVYQEAEEHTEDYARLLSSLQAAWQRLQNILSQAELQAEQLESLQDRESTLRQAQLRCRQDLQVAQTKMQELRDFLDRPENRELAARIAELNREEKENRETERNADVRCQLAEKAIQDGKTERENLNDKLRTAVMDEMDLELYFKEDLALELTMKQENRSLPECAQLAVSAVSALDRERSVERLNEALGNNFNQHRSSLLQYNPKMELGMEKSGHPGTLRERSLITLRLDGQELPLNQFLLRLQAKLEEEQLVLQESDRKLFEEIMSDTVSHKLRYRIEESRKWVDAMSALMKTLRTSMGLSFGLDWKPIQGGGGEELGTKELVELLSKDSRLLTPEDSQRVSVHFRTRLNRLRQNTQDADLMTSYADLIREVLDYRKWYEFRLYYQRTGMERKELTDKAFNTFSGGEKAMAIYLPQFVAVSAQYQKGGKGCPWMLALDEAFAGVDDQNISAMFELVHTLGFDYIMNSQALWGCYPCVSSLDIAEFCRPDNAQTVTIIHYHWNGREKVMVEST